MILSSLTESLRDRYYVRVDGSRVEIKERVLQAIGPVLDTEFLKQCRIDFGRTTSYGTSDNNGNYLTVYVGYPEHRGSSAMQVMIRKLHGKSYVKVNDILQRLLEPENHFKILKGSGNFQLS